MQLDKNLQLQRGNLATCMQMNLLAFQISNCSELMQHFIETQETRITNADLNGLL